MKYQRGGPASTVMLLLILTVALAAVISRTGGVLP